MKLTAMVMMMASAAGVWAAENGEARRKVTVCAEHGTAGPVAHSAEVLAARMFAKIGVQIEWRVANSCAGIDNALAITFSDGTPANRLPGTLAYALPYEGTHVVVFYDRIKDQVKDPVVPILLAHVLVHEITHILQGVSRHSASGVMKAGFSAADHDEMKRNGLGFAKEDIDLIHIGLDTRQSRLAENTLIASR